MAKMSKSPWLLHYDASSCNGCDIEVLASTTPVYDLERFGIINTGNPKHADILLITGGVQPVSVPATAVCSRTATIFSAGWTRSSPWMSMRPAALCARNA